MKLKDEIFEFRSNTGYGNIIVKLKNIEAQNNDFYIAKNVSIEFSIGMEEKNKEKWLQEIKQEMKRFFEHTSFFNAGKGYIFKYQYKSRKKHRKIS